MIQNLLRVRLPFPDRRLSPNVRRVWQASLIPKREAREVGYYAAHDATFRKGRWHSVSLKNTMPLRLRIAIYPPDNRRRDLDNIVAAIKSYQDGIFSYMGLDDSMITHKEVIMRRSCPEGKIIYLLYQK